MGSFLRQEQNRSQVQDSKSPRRGLSRSASTAGPAAAPCHPVTQGTFDDVSAMPYADLEA